MDFIFMLTRQDQTVVDALEVFAEIRPLGLRHVGFKDVGVDKGTLHALDQAIKAAGATSYMEVVSTSPEAALQSARVAAEIGIDRLLGGTSVAEILAIIKDCAIAYYPFPGRPVGLGWSRINAGASARWAVPASIFWPIGRRRPIPSTS